MSGQVTRAQAEAALERVLRSDYKALGDITPVERREVDATILRAYLAQHPDEETVRKGHAALEIRKDFFVEIQRLLGELAYPDDWDDDVVRVKDAVVHIQGYLDRLEEGR